MKKARKVHFVLADPNVSYRNMHIMTIREYVENHDVLACSPQLSDETRVTMWAPYITCKACRKAMLEAGIVGVMSHSFMRDIATKNQHQK
jgi:hypothetical protein